MKKCLKFGLISITVLVALIFCIPQNNFKVYASEYSYTADVVTDYDTTFLNGISSVDSVNFDYIMHYQFSYPQPLPFKIIIDCGNTFPYLSNFTTLGIRLNPYQYIDYDIVDFNCSLLLHGEFSVVLFDYGYAEITGVLSKVIITDCFFDVDRSNWCDPFPYCNNSNSNAHISYRRFCDNSSKLSSYVDFNSETNYIYDLSSIIEYDFNSLTQNVIDFFTLKGNDCFFTSNILEDISSFGLDFYSTSNGSGRWNAISKNSHYYFTCDFYLTNANMSNYTFVIDYSSLLLRNFEIKVNRPVYRTENTLVIYNYDYDCAVSSISSVEYALSKNGDTYKAKYTGSVPNSTTIGFVCEELQNRLYDEYIYIYLTFNNNQVDFSNTGQFSLGFDFNFSRFYEPLVIDTSSDFDSYGLPSLKKPKKLTDIGGWIDYATKWVFFYNPIVKPVSKVIGSIFSMLVVCVKFLVDLPLGGFVLSFIGFMVFYKLLSAFMPSFSPKSVVNLTTNVFEKTSSSYREDARIQREKQEMAREQHEWKVKNADKLRYVRNRGLFRKYWHYKDTLEDDRQKAIRREKKNKHNKK